MSVKGKKLLIVVNVDWFLISHRFLLVKQAVQLGYEVHIACKITMPTWSLEELGVTVHKLPLLRGQQIYDLTLILDEEDGPMKNNS